MMTVWSPAPAPSLPASLTFSAVFSILSLAPMWTSGSSKLSPRLLPSAAWKIPSNMHHRPE